MKKIAFCFLIYDSINHEEIWKLFFNNVDPSKYNIYIHYKINKPLKYFEQYKLDNCIETKYGDISLIKAQDLMYKEALKDKDNKFFINLSNSCIPLKNFHHIYNSLLENYSYFNICNQDSCFPRCNYLLNSLPKKSIQKSSMWCILNRKHTELIVNDKQHINWFDITKTFSELVCPDEHSYITYIYHSNLENEIITTPNLANGATTFTNWQGMDYKYPSTRGLKNYSFISQEELHYLMNSQCLFGRKFVPECILSLCNTDYLHFISNNQQKK